MQFRSLSNIPIETIVDCFHSAFSDYFVPIHATVDFWQQRWKRARVDYFLSFGVFDKDKLVAFVLHGVEKEWVFNVGTGVIPTYRGQKLVKYIYDNAIPLLKENGITNCGLEVITQNEKAIKAYQQIGFAITKNYKCFSGTISAVSAKDGYTFEQQPVFNWPAYQPLREYSFSWENTDSALQANGEGFEVWELRRQHAPALHGYVILNKQNGYIAQFGVQDFEQHGSQLFQEIGQLLNVPLKIHNVAGDASQTITLLQNIGLTNYIDQYEMALTL